MRRRNNPLSAALPATIKGVLIVMAAAVSGGCEDYLDRRDTVTRGAGESVAFNKATQTIDRWPRAARRDRWNSDGERARLAVERYRKGTVTPPPPVGTSATSEATGAAAAAK